MATKSRSKSKASSKARTKARPMAKPKAKPVAQAKARGKLPAKPAAVPRKALAVGGPVTLEEARALARARQPKRALRRVAAGPPATPASVGAERERLEQERRAERARRMREYTETMEIMKRRGARRSGPKRAATGRRRAPGAAASFQPLQVFAEGDSWFDYPPFLIKGGVIPRLESRLGVPILNMAKAGDEVRFMLGVEQRIRLAECLTEGCPAGGPWDALLFSGGGNDIVDNPMALWVRDWNPAVPPATLINQPRFDVALALVRAGYEDLITLRDQLSPGTHLVFHGYDFAIPDGRGICHLGPWLKPTFDLRGFPTRASAFAVVEAMLKQFAAMLTTLTAHPKVTFINGQGTLAPQPSAWHNELHPNKDGFEKFADLFHQELRAIFPGRVL
jgi:hypothetical protein